MGLTKHLTVQPFARVFRDPGCFYTLNVMGIESELAHALDLNHGKIRRSEFCWLSDPQQPRLVLQEASMCQLSFEGIRFCGFTPPRMPEDAIEYVLEMSEGCEYKEGGLGSRFITDLSVNNFRPVYRSHVAGAIVEVGDLRPSMWYHARLAIEYMDHRVVSEALPFFTLRDVPLPPPMPRIYVTPSVSQIDPAKEQEPIVLLTWTAPRSNGSEIIKYQVQFQETVMAQGGPVPLSAFTTIGGAGDEQEQIPPYSPAFSKSNKPKLIQMEAADGKNKKKKGVEAIRGVVTLPPFSPPKPQYAVTGSCARSKWAVIYTNLEHKLKLKAPRRGVIEWKFRIRACNAQGWSDFSSILSIHNRSHPVLFPLEFPADEEAPYTKSPVINHHNQQQHDDGHLLSGYPILHTSLGFAPPPSHLLDLGASSMYEQDELEDVGLSQASLLKRTRALSAAASTSSKDGAGGIEKIAGGGGNAQQQQVDVWIATDSEADEARATAGSRGFSAPPRSSGV